MDVSFFRQTGFPGHSRKKDRHAPRTYEDKNSRQGGSAESPRDDMGPAPHRTSDIVGELDERILSWPGLPEKERKQTTAVKTAVDGRSFLWRGVD